MTFTVRWGSLAAIWTRIGWAFTAAGVGVAGPSKVVSTKSPRKKIIDLFNFDRIIKNSFL
jgi:hypothetical protein